MVYDDLFDWMLPKKKLKKPPPPHKKVAVEPQDPKERNVSQMTTESTTVESLLGNNNDVRARSECENNGDVANVESNKNGIVEDDCQVSEVNNNDVIATKIVDDENPLLISQVVAGEAVQLGNS